MSALDGYNRFKNDYVPKNQSHLAKQAEGQSPETLFITCSDSRICPNAITDTKEGELFVIRNAGNTIPKEGLLEGNADSATVEYAVKVLGVKEIIVCGHSHCGAINALLGGAPAELKNINTYLNHLSEFKKVAQEKEWSVENSIKENVKAQLSNIHSYGFVKEQVAAGKLKLTGWLYHIESGEVEVLD